MKRFRSSRDSRQQAQNQQHLLAGDDEEKAAEERCVSIMDAAANKPYKFCDNSVTTAKYSLIPLSWNFILWKNLFEQFKKAANLYFLGVSIMQVIPGLSPTGRFTTLIPLVLVLAASMLKDGWEDWKRRVADRVINNRVAHVWRNGKWERVLWTQVQVGDVVKVYKNDAFPADLVLVWSSEAEGLCYIETANLDGETNLKPRKSPLATYSLIKKQPTEPDEHGRVHPVPTALQGKVVCELPNNRLYQFVGYLERMDGDKLQPRMPLVADNILLRGSELRNTGCIYGICIFTGTDTKLVRNMTTKHLKTSRMDGVTNKQIFYVFLFQILISTFCAIGFRIAAADISTHWYLAGDRNVDGSSAISFITFMILFNSLIPISLYVMMEVVKLIQAYFINSDVRMYHDVSDTPAAVRNSKLNEELGQVEFIFSDKTGTLTCNMMEFRKFCVPSNDPTGEVTTFGSMQGPPGSPGPASPAALAAAAAAGKEVSSFYDPAIIGNKWKSLPNKEQVRSLFNAMAVCHTVIPENENGRIVYQASSPDEGCLVKAARSLGIEMVHRTESTVTIAEAGGKRETWQLLTVIEFSSARKRMSVIVRDPLGRLQLLTKGADSVIMERLRRNEFSAPIYEQTERYLKSFAADGLRTLVFAKQDLAEDVYKRWKKRFEQAATAIHERQEKIDIAANELEKDLDLIGATAIEDKLQDQVPQTIELLQRAGCKLWVLTGDKQETAINIGFSCAMLNSNMGLFKFDDCTPATLKHALEKYLLDVEAASVEAGQDIGLIIQGHMLQYILPSKDDPHANEYECDLFVSLAIRCKAVICCRVSPIQKAQVVQAVKDRVNGVTLAIGDGANDVSMLQMAHVGIGISGLEGLQAARASDYSISQFRFLQRLLLVHGRWSYRRIARLIVFTFYKNMSLYMTQFLFSLYNMFTGQTLYDPWALAFYNLAFTAFPIMALAVFDRDVEDIRVLSLDQFPELYQDGIKNKLFNTVEFWKYTVTALVHSIISFFIPMYAWSSVTEAYTGRDLGLAGHAVSGFSSVLIIVTLKCGLETNTWTVANVALTLASMYFWYLFLFFYCSLYRYAEASDFAPWYGADTRTLRHAVYWLVSIQVPVVALLRDFVYKFWRRNYDPVLFHVVQEFEIYLGNFDRHRIKREVPWLFPKQEVKAFKPTLSEGVGHHRFTQEDTLLGTGSPTASGFFSAEATPGRRKIRISDIIEEEML